MENGDDWFYFEDEYTGSSAQKTAAAAAPVRISTVSATETEILRLKYSSRPRHTIVHKGACSFTGIKTSGEKQSEHSGLTVQVNVADL